MNMEEQLKKVKHYETVSVERDIETKQAEIKALETAIKDGRALLRINKQKNKATKLVQDFVIKHYTKIPEKCEFTWETKPEYWELNKQLQLTMNKESALKEKMELANIKSALETNKANLEIAKTALKITKESLKEKNEVTQ